MNSGLSRESEKELFRNIAHRYVLMASGCREDDVSLATNSVVFDAMEQGNSVLVIAAREALRRALHPSANRSPEDISEWDRELAKIWDNQRVTFEEVEQRCVVRTHSISRNELQKRQTAVFSPWQLSDSDLIGQQPLTLSSLE